MEKIKYEKSKSLARQIELYFMITVLNIYFFFRRNKTNRSNFYTHKIEMSTRVYVHTYGIDYQMTHIPYKRM